MFLARMLDTGQSRLDHLQGNRHHESASAYFVRQVRFGTATVLRMIKAWPDDSR